MSAKWDRISAYSLTTKDKIEIELLSLRFLDVIPFSL